MADILSFEPFDAVAAGELWAMEDPKNAGDTVRILINGKDIVELFNAKDKVGHVGARWIYRLLTESCDTGDVWSDYGAELGRCIHCGEPGCDYIRTDKREENEFVSWRMQHEHGDGKTLEFCFEKKQYDEAMEELRKLAL